MISSVSSSSQNTPSLFVASFIKDTPAYTQKKDSANAASSQANAPSKESYRTSFGSADIGRKTNEFEIQTLRTITPLEVIPYSPQDSLHPKSEPSELDLWAVPPCMGTDAYPVIGLGGSVPNSEEYNKLCEKLGEASEKVVAEYGLDELTREERYQKTFGEMSEEMTAFFYDSLDQEGKDLVKLFRPDTASKYNL